MLNALNHDPIDVQPEGGLMSHHAQSIIGIQKYGLLVQEPNSSNRDQLVLFDYYPKLFNSEKKSLLLLNIILKNFFTYFFNCFNIIFWVNSDGCEIITYKYGINTIFQSKFHICLA